MYIQNGNPLKKMKIDSLNQEICEPVEKSIKAKIASSFRLKISLDEPNGCNYPEYNYAEILDQEKHRIHNEINCGEVVEEVLDISRLYQKKYRHPKANEVIQYSSGYDKEDPFIDDSDAQDENVPNELTHGKFYVNTKSPQQTSDTVSTKSRCSSKTQVNSKKNPLSEKNMKMKKGNNKVCKAPTRKVKNK